MVSAWRITKRKHSRSAFTGEGARLYGGRWNSPGTAMIYTAESQSLAVLEILVHLDSPELLKKYVLFKVRIGKSYIVDIDAALLPRNWRAEPAPGKVQKIGDEWVINATSAVLRVPSTLVPGESNFLLNPQHPDFPKLQFSEAIPFHFDPRLIERHWLPER
jgi:RES domain-containing protein